MLYKGREGRECRRTTNGTGNSAPGFVYLEILGVDDSEVPVIYSFT